MSRATMEAHNIITENVTLIDKKNYSTEHLLIVHSSTPEQDKLIITHINRHARSYYRIDKDDMYLVSPSGKDHLLGRVDIVDELTAKGEDFYFFSDKKYYRVIPHNRPDYTEH